MVTLSMWQACIKDKRYETDRQMADSLIHHNDLYDV